MPNADYVDFLAEKMIYSSLVYTKWVPSLSYNILAKEQLIPNEREIPIEIRVCSKEAYIVNKVHKSIQKLLKTKYEDFMSTGIKGNSSV